MGYGPWEELLLLPGEYGPVKTRYGFDYHLLN